MGYKIMISIKTLVEQMLALLSLSFILLATLTNATRRFDLASAYRPDDVDEPRLAYLRPLYSEVGTNLDDVGRSDQELDLAATSQGALVNALIDQWLQGAQVGIDGAQSLYKREVEGETARDVNSHLPSTNPFGEPANQVVLPQDDYQIKGPVNDPDEFEAKLSELTNALNHKMSNSLERHQLLVAMLNESSATGDQDARQAPQLSESLIERLEKLLESRQGRDDVRNNDDDDDETRTMDNEINSADLITSTSPADDVPTSEYIDHPLALFGHQMVQGGAGEGRQLLGPDGTFENIQVIKTDSAIPSYCDPPNPCPIGYTAADGCIENFINSASFSREYQAKQKCSCDNEHSLFNCASPSSASEQQADDSTGSSEDSTSSSSSDADDELQTDGPMAKLDTLARTIQNRFGDLATVRKLISDQQASHQQANPFEAQNDNADSNYLARSARKWSPELNYHKTELD